MAGIFIEQTTQSRSFTLELKLSYIKQDSKFMFDNLTEPT